jgi:hypothetical protein
MARILSDKPNGVTFFDRISESKITLFYRMPTTEERIAYSNSLITRRGTKVESNIGEARGKYGARILTGFKDGDFATEDGPLSSDPASPNFKPNWKAILLQYAQDVVDMLAIHVFEASLMIDTPDDEVKTEDPL